MKSKSIKIITAVFSVCITAVIIYYYINPYFFQLKIDTFHAVLYDLKYKFDISDNYDVLYASDTPQYVNIYENIDEKFFHFGNFLFFRSNGKTDINILAEYTLKYTGFYKESDIHNAIIKYNSLDPDTGFIESGVTIFIPDSLPSLIKDWHNNKLSPIRHIKGLYFTGSNAGQKGFFNTVLKFKKAGINAIVFDVKDIPGIISYKSSLEQVKKLNTHEKRSIDDISKLIRFLKNENIYVIARIACFRDELLIRKRPDLAIQSASTGSVWNKGSSELWLDPTNKEAQDYNIALAVELARYGVDEIQFDYIRFPTAGDLSDAVYKYSYGRKSNQETITEFLARAYEQIHKYKTNVSIDIFGIVAWGYSGDIIKTGQDIGMLSKYTDVISPMLYPSHFDNNFRGHSNPADYPYYFISEGNKKVSALAGNETVIRPWLQAFNLRVTNYNEDYILQQIKAADDTSSGGYLFWNAGNSYDVVYRALLSSAGK
ncbi:MAG: hypothetical protein JW982_15250 [Spirochaetes bacterium]|nr:hypothetical protein [Spirochaetota bacterium]